MINRHIIIRVIVLLFCCPILFISSRAQDNNKIPIKQSTVSNTFRPKRVEATADKIRNLKVPAGFRIEVFAQGTGNPRMMEVMEDGTVYVTDRNNGRLTMLRDTNKDGKADVIKVLLEMEHLHGIDYRSGKLYLVTVKEVYTAVVKKDGTLGLMKPIISDLPDAGQHHNRTLKFGPDSLMYISIGSTCNSCEETNKEAATMLQTRPDGSSRHIYSKGLRNTIGFDWHPVTKELWGWDNGMDHLGDTVNKEELNKLQDGADYGWPFIFEKGKFARHHDPKNSTHEAYVTKTTFPSLLYHAHSAPMEFMFYTGNQFPPEYQHDAFVAMRGSWNRQQPSGYRVLRVRFDKTGQPIATEDFFYGFLVDDNTGEFGRVVGLAHYIDGSLLVSDDVNGVIYRIIYNR